MVQIPLVASTLIVGIVGTGVAALSTSGYNQESEPVHLPLKDDPLFDDSVDYSNPGYISFGKKYKWYMVGQARTNRRWWNKTFLKLQQEKESAGKEFQKVEYPWWFWGDESLNRVCRQAYIKYFPEVEGNKEDAKGDDAMGRKYREDDVWKYCSIPSKKPSTIGSSGGYSSGKLGADSSLTNHLISTKDDSNDVFWEIRNREFFEEIGIQAALYKNNFFAELFTKQMMSQSDTIKEKCEEAYGKEAANASSKDAPTKEEVLKFCSLTTN